MSSRFPSRPQPPPPRSVQRYKTRLRNLKNAKGSAEDASFFVEGRQYVTHKIGGTDPNTRYTCVYVSMTLVVFSFKYQGIERTYTAYHKDMQHGDWVQPAVAITND